MHVGHVVDIVVLLIVAVMVANVVAHPQVVQILGNTLNQALKEARS